MMRPRRRLSTAVVLLLGLVSLPGPGNVAPATASSSCAYDPLDSTVTVAAVTETLDVTLVDGRSLRLAGIAAPLATATSPDLPARARQALVAWGAAPGGVVLHVLAPGPDRWGRVGALLFRKDKPDSAAEALIQAGLARARPESAAHACFPALLAAEAEARNQRRGLWVDPRYAVLDASDAEGLAVQGGDMALVQGILHQHQGRGALYLALGRDRWGFVAIVSRRDALRFAKAGFDVADYEGTPVRLRGDLDLRFGARMRLTDPDAVESLEPGSLGPEPDAKHWTARARPR